MIDYQQHVFKWAHFSKQQNIENMYNTIYINGKKKKKK